MGENDGMDISSDELMRLHTRKPGYGKEKENLIEKHDLF